MTMTDLVDIQNLINTDQLVASLSGLVNMPSPTGEEAEVASFVANQLEALGCEADTYALSDSQVSTLGVLKGQKPNKNLLLYSPLDTVTSNSAEEDLPWASPTMRDDLRAKAYVKDGHVVGLGAHNPKGHAACIIEAARVLKKLNVPLQGNVYFGFGAGGMPTHSRPNMPLDTGHGVGCQNLIDNMPKLDAAIVAKSGFAVTWEEVGFIWMDVRVSGTHTYVGSRHLLPYSNPIANASKLILKLEDWFEERAENHATENVKPQAVVSFAESGWERMPAFTPDSCRFIADLRFGPNTTGKQAEAEFRDKVKEFSKELGISVECKNIQTIEASATDFNSDIIQTTIGAWQDIKQRPHQPFTEMSGGTDANILRLNGIPTSRMGLPKAKLEDLDFAMGMNCASIEDLRDLTAMLVLSVIRYLKE